MNNNSTGIISMPVLLNKLGAARVKMTYEENVRKIAEKLKAVLIKDYLFDNIPSGGIDDAARKAIDFAKEEVKEFCKEWGDEYAREEVSKYLIERGLIPAQEVTSDVCRRCGVDDKTVKHYFSIGAALCKSCFFNSPSNEQK